MQDPIALLCRKLLWSEDPEELRPVANQLQNAICERMDRIREKAIGMAIVDRVVDLDSFTGTHAKKSAESASQSAG